MPCLFRRLFILVKVRVAQSTLALTGFSETRLLVELLLFSVGSLLLFSDHSLIVFSDRSPGREGLIFSDGSIFVFSDRSPGQISLLGEHHGENLLICLSGKSLDLYINTQIQISPAASRRFNIHAHRYVLAIVIICNICVPCPPSSIQE